MSLWTLLSLAVTRLFVNMTRRFAYPFLPEISRQLDVPLAQVQTATAFQSATGITSPIFGPLSERYGRKRVMVGALSLLSLACVPGIFFLQAGVFYLVVIVFGFAKIIFDPAMQAYISDNIPYQNRARAIGITELSWAGALIVAAPVTGFLLGAWGLQAVFILLLACGLTGVVLLWRFIPADHPDADAKIERTGLRTVARTLGGNPLAIGAIAFALLQVAANEIIFIVFGAWMEDRFGLISEELGLAAIVIAAAEVTGEVLVIRFADQIGKKRITLATLLLSSLGYLALPFIGVSVGLALGLLFLIFVCVEVSIVASIPLISELLPSTRAIMLSGYTAAVAVGRFAGAAIGTFIYATGNFTLSGAAAAGVAFLSAMILWRVVHEGS